MRPLNLEFWAVAIPTAFAVASLLVRMGRRRERVDNMKRGFAADIRNLRDNLNQRFDALESGLADVRTQVFALRDLFFGSERRQGGVEGTLQSQGQRIDQLERTVLGVASSRIAT